jgi:hypothetical protein
MEKIELLLTNLAEESANGKPIVVEGKKDLVALRELGVNGEILTVKLAANLSFKRPWKLNLGVLSRLFFFWTLIEEEEKAPNVCRRAWNGGK